MTPWLLLAVVLLPSAALAADKAAPSPYEIRGDSGDNLEELGRKGNLTPEAEAELNRALRELRTGTPAGKPDQAGAGTKASTPKRKPAAKARATSRTQPKALSDQNTGISPP